jgi:hypothetical protein|tara:strand:- start:61 stop:192 length:132 start_codon:yes stop_codon:yes gene_type:complete
MLGAALDTAVNISKVLHFNGGFMKRCRENPLFAQYGETVINLQ